jgi:hypothetical protein
MPDVFDQPILDSVQEFEPSDTLPRAEVTPSPPAEPPDSTQIALTESLSGQKDEFAATIAQTDTGKRILQLFQLTMKYDGDVKRAMTELGYEGSDPHTLVRSKTFTQIMDHYFPLQILAAKDLYLLNHPDWRANNAALDRLHKLRGDFTTKVEIKVSDDKIRQLSDEQLRNVVEGELVNDDNDSDETR